MRRKVFKLQDFIDHDLTHLVFVFGGHKYVLCANRESKYHSTKVDLGYHLCFNINSRTTRCLRGCEFIELLDERSKEAFLKPKGGTKVNRLMDPKEIELRTNPDHASQLDIVQDAVADYIGKEQVAESSGVREIDQGDEPRRAVLVELDLAQEVQDYLQSKGFHVGPVLHKVPSGVFYPPTKTELKGYKVAW